MTYTPEETQQFCDEGMGNEYEARCLDQQGTWNSGNNDAPTTVTIAPEPTTTTSTTTPVTTPPTLPVTGPQELITLALIAATFLSAGYRMIQRSEKTRA